jgi:hypothetical protein
MDLKGLRILTWHIHGSYLFDLVQCPLGQPDETVIPEVMVIPMRQSSWP